MFEAELAALETQAQDAVKKFTGGVISGAATTQGVIVNNTQAIPISGSTTQGGLSSNKYWMLLLAGAAVGGYFLLKRKSGRV